jgi:NAD(P)-dependent dehydrogenase (short-subunit alcohol dehydrogenase family)
MPNPVVLLTGALTGIGRATALAFGRMPARVVISGRHDEAGRDLAEELRVLGGEAEFIRADVAHEEAVRSLVDQTVAHFGRLDIAVNNAGTEGKAGPITEQSVENYAAVFAANVLGVMLCMKHELRVMQPQRSGNIVNLSSIVGHKAFAGEALYVASKHAVEGLTKSAALEAAPYGIRVNAVAPGPIDTGMLDRFAGNADTRAALLATIPLKRAGGADEIAQTILFLASEKASFITGHILATDGGLAAA